LSNFLRAFPANPHALMATPMSVQLNGGEIIGETVSLGIAAALVMTVLVTDTLLGTVINVSQGIANVEGNGKSVLMSKLVGLTSIPPACVLRSNLRGTAQGMESDIFAIFHSLCLNHVTTQECLARMQNFNSQKTRNIYSIPNFFLQVEAMNNQSTI
jgi:hypothetical protein